MASRIVSKEKLSEHIFTAEIEAPLVAKARKPGQFVIIGINSEYSERIPLTIADADPQKGTIQLIWQRVGKTTAELADVQVGGEIATVVGPLGRPTRIENFGFVFCCVKEIMQQVIEDKAFNRLWQASMLRLTLRKLLTNAYSRKLFTKTKRLLIILNPGLLPLNFSHTFRLKTPELFDLNIVIQ